MNKEMKEIHNVGRRLRQADRLQRILDEQGLTWQEVAWISGCTVRQVGKYVAGDAEMPAWRLRLLRLELGLERPRWTPAKRKARLIKRLTGG